MSINVLAKNAKILGRNIVELKYKNDNEICSLCLKEMKNTKVQHTLCGHTFHSSCLEQQFKSNYKNKKKCSLCREELVEVYKRIQEYDFNRRYGGLKRELLYIYEDIYKLYIKIEYGDNNANDANNVNDVNDANVREMNNKCNTMNETYDKLVKLCKNLFKVFSASTIEYAEEEKEYNDNIITTSEDIEKAIKQIEDTHKKIITLRNDIKLYVSNTFSTDGVDSFVYHNYYYVDMERIIYEIFVDDCSDKDEEKENNAIVNVTYTNVQ